MNVSLNESFPCGDQYGSPSSLASSETEDFTRGIVPTELAFAGLRLAIPEDGYSESPDAVF